MHLYHVKDLCHRVSTHLQSINIIIIIINKSETGSESKVTILWNQQPKTDSSIQNYKSYIIKSKVSPLEVYVA